jgi:hypothetical protein
MFDIKVLTSISKSVVHLISAWGTSKSSTNYQRTLSTIKANTSSADLTRGSRAEEEGPWILGLGAR